jgi:hypothetical protein
VADNLKQKHDHAVAKFMQIRFIDGSASWQVPPALFLVVLSKRAHFASSSVGW